MGERGTREWVAEHIQVVGIDDVISRIGDGGEVDDRVAAAERREHLVVVADVELDVAEPLVFACRVFGNLRRDCRRHLVNAHDAMALRECYARDALAEVAAGASDRDLHAHGGRVSAWGCRWDSPPRAPLISFRRVRGAE